MRVVYAGKERLVEAPADLSIGRLAEAVGHVFAPVESPEASARYELRCDGILLAENERVGKVCASIQPGRPLELYLKLEREPASPQPAPAAPIGVPSGAAWVLGGRALAVSGEWGVRLWDAEKQSWQESPVVTLPILKLATCDSFILCALKNAQIALWEFNDTGWYGQANRRLRSAITSLALNRTTAAAGTEEGNVYWFRVPDLEPAQELPSIGKPVRLLHWLDDQYCLQLYANAALEIRHLDDTKPVFETKLDTAAHIVGAATVEEADTSGALILFAEPMTWVWVALNKREPTILRVEQPASRPVSMAYDAKSHKAWVGLADGSVQTWQVNDVGRSLELCDSRKPVSGLRSVLLSHDHRYLIVVDQDNQVSLHSP
ncbi:hypothetical protein [Candidatus Roseilinea sp. NK_OTU-006]|uniref:hypothetical protein n=1 Tax=Candidatus Roseilinea sp. NK_OTU-006 TaxID=2704250 RepID=UPI00145C58DA|nr:hypothetical protein [Candidatus Roseilinea sp. NK_OTU-006]